MLHLEKMEEEIADLRSSWATKTKNDMDYYMHEQK